MATSSAPKAQSAVNHHPALGGCLLLGHNAEMSRATFRGATELRLKICGSPECRAVFAVCASCDRGQRYCSPSCREHVRRKLRREANRRYQQSEQGRQFHRHRQRRYRERQAQARTCVTDQGLRTVPAPVRPRISGVCRCKICGRYSHWINPFPVIPRRR